MKNIDMIKIYKYTLRDTAPSTDLNILCKTKFLAILVVYFDMSLRKLILVDKYPDLIPLAQ